MKNMLVTGGCGFIGTNFIRYLLKADDFEGTIVNLDCLSYAGNPANLKGYEDTHAGRYIFVHGDICDTQKLATILDQYKIDTICHFAAESHVDRSIVGPDRFIRTNINGTFNLLEQVRRRIGQIGLFHHISTDEVYGSLGENGYFREDTPYDPSSPYSASKAASDHLVNAYARTYGIPVTISNCSNNYGPFQFPEKLIPLMILNAFQGRELPVYGDGRNVRDWLYVNDHCRAIWEIMKRGGRGETYNIGGRCERRNIDVVHAICAVLDDRQPLENDGPRTELIRFVTDRPGHDRRYAIDCSKLMSELQWRPEESFESGLEKTVDWYMNNPQWVQDVRSGEYRKWMETQYG